MTPIVAEYPRGYSAGIEPKPHLRIQKIRVSMLYFSETKF